ncbi:MAG: SCO family protein, partial [Bryobacteraceae bacterium]
MTVRTHENRKVLFYDDLLRAKTVLIHCMSIANELQHPVIENLSKVQAALGARLGRDVFIYSLSVDPENDTPRALKAFAEKHGARPGWLFLTADAGTVMLLQGRLFAREAGHSHGAVEDCSLSMIRYGNEAAGLWGTAPACADPVAIAERVSWVTPSPFTSGARAAGPPRRKGPLPLAALAVALGLASQIPSTSQVAANTMCPVPNPQDQPCAGTGKHPAPQPKPVGACVTKIDNITFNVVTGKSCFPESDPFLDPPGTNFLPTLYTDLRSADSTSIPNTLPSTPAI